MPIQLENTLFFSVALMNRNPSSELSVSSFSVANSGVMGKSSNSISPPSFGVFGLIIRILLASPVDAVSEPWDMVAIRGQLSGVKKAWQIYGVMSCP